MNLNFINQKVTPIDPGKVSQLVLPDGTLMPQSAMGTFHSDNPDLIESM